MVEESVGLVDLKNVIAGEFAFVRLKTTISRHHFSIIYNTDTKTLEFSCKKSQIIYNTLLNYSRY